ncbi:MAG: helix-turn-helix transcriptional regulator [Christensenellaceae bacterium]|nr:helix-turn-helix transcriptional regulator [Christensenellaceae bacterium]
MDAQKRIRELMEERGWSGYKLAKEANLSHSTVSNIFNRNNAPTLPTIEAVCRAFGLTLEQFFSDGDCPTKMTEEQRNLFAMWSSMTDEQKEALLHLMNTMK